MVEMNGKTDNESFFIAEYSKEEMLARLGWVILKPQNIMVLGRALTESVKGLQEKFPLATIITDVNNISAENTIDLIFANLVLPWVNLKEELTKWRQFLRPEGMILFSTFGPDTLQELANLPAVKVLPHFVDMHHIGDALVENRFIDPVLDVEMLTITYEDKEKLRKEMHEGSMLQSKDIIEIQKNAEGFYPVSFELVFGHAWGPALTADHVMDEEGVVKIPLAHLRRKAL